MRATIQLCTYNRAHLLERVLDGCFEQTVAGDCYEVVLVNDGSSDETPAVIETARRRATCAFTVVEQANAGLARGRNAGIARARGERIIFIDDDVLPAPVFVEEHLRSHERRPEAIVRGAVINTQSFERLPTPTWTLANYSANYFWTSNVSVPRRTLERVGNFTESFVEYGWEDIELGMRLRAAGVRGIFNVAGPPPLPLSRVIKLVGRPHLPVPYSMAKLLLRRMWSLRLSNFPVPELDHIRFVCMVDDARARRELDFSPRVPIEDTVRSVVADQW